MNCTPHCFSGRTRHFSDRCRQRCIEDFEVDLALLFGVSKEDRNGQTFLTGSQVTAIESVRLLSGRETCVLTDCPRTHSVHTAVRAT